MSLWRSPLLYFGIGLILIAAAALAAPLYMNWNSYRSDIEDYGRQFTGRKVFIGGDIHARLFPWPVIWLSDVRVDNPPGTKEPELMRAEAVEMRLALAPLVSGKIVVEGIRIDKPVFAFERMATGEGTWQLSPRVALGDVINVEAVTVAGIEIVDGTIILADGRRGGTAKIEDVDANLSAPTLAGPWRLRSLMSYGGQRISAGISTGKFHPGAPVPFGVRLAPEQASGLVYSFDGVLGAANEGVRGQLKIRQQAAQENQDNGQPPARAMTFKADVVADFGGVEFSKIEIAPEDVTDAANLLNGSARITLGSTIALDTSLHAARLDIDEITGSLGHGFVFGGELFATLADVLGTLPDRVEGNVKLDVTSLVFGGEVLDGAKLDIEIEQGRLRINTLEASMPGQTRGRFTGSFLPAGKASQLVGDISLDSISLHDFVNWVALSYKDDIERVWSGARGRLKLTGKLDATASRTRLSEGQFVFDDARGLGNILVAGGKEPALSVRIVVDSVNIDRYAPGGLTPEAIDAGVLAGAVDLAGKAMQVGEFSLKLQADYLNLHGVTGEDIAIDIAANADGIEFRTVEIGRVGDARLDIAGLLNFPETGVSGAVTADVEAKDPRGLLRLLGLVPRNSKNEPAWLSALGPLDIKVSGEATTDSGNTGALLTIKGLAGVTELDLSARFNGDHTAWTRGDVHVSGDLSGKSARALAGLTGVPLAGDVDSAVKLFVSSTGIPEDGMALSAEIDALGAQAQFAGTLAVDARSDVMVDGRLAVLAERAQQLYAAAGLAGDDLSPAAQVLSGEGKLNYADGRWSYDGLSGTAAGTAYRGNLSVDTNGDAPKFGVKLTAGRLQLPWLLQLALMSREATPQGAATNFDSTGALPGNFDLTVKVTELATLPGINLRDAQVTLSQAGGQLDVVVGGKTAAGVPVDADVTFKRGALGVAASGKLSGGLELGELLQAVDGTVPLSGRVDLSASFAGTGRSPSGLISSLAGKGSYKLTGPVLARIDPVKFTGGLSQLKDAGDLDRLIASALFSGEMAFAGSSSTLDIENGVVKFDRLPVTAQGASGHLATLLELTSGQVDISAMLKLDALKGLPAFEVAYAGHPKALEQSRDLAALKSFIGVKILQKGLDKLEKLQREADRLFQEEMRYERERVKAQLLREAERKKREEAARKKAEEERLRIEVEARLIAEEEARRLTEELRKRQLEEEARRLQAEVARKLAEEEARRLTEEAAARTRLEKHIRRVIADPAPDLAPDPAPDPVPDPAPETTILTGERPAPQPSTQVTIDPPPLPANKPIPVRPAPQPARVVPAPTPPPAREPDRPDEAQSKIDR